RIAIMGHSAGGHLAAAIAAQAGQGGLPGIRHVFAVSGVFDLPPLLPSSINNALQLDLTRAESLSPITLPAPAHTQVRTLVGGNETRQFHLQSQALGQVWPVVAHYSVPDTDHFTILNVLADSTSQLTRDLVAALLN